MVMQMTNKRKYEIEMQWGIDEFLPGEGGWSGGESQSIIILGRKRTIQCFRELKAVLKRYGG